LPGGFCVERRAFMPASTFTPEERMDALEERLDAMGERLQTINALLAGMEPRLDRIGDAIERLASDDA
jgi:uncharacterized coiled-coil protein SlyX